MRELFGGIRLGIDTLLYIAAARIGLRHRFYDFAVKPADDVLGRSFRRNQSVPDHEFRIRKSGLGHGLYAGHARYALPAGGDNHANFSGLGERNHRRNADHDHGHFATKQIGDRIRAAFVRHMHDVSAGVKFEHLAEQMVDAAHAG